MLFEQEIKSWYRICREDPEETTVQGTLYKLDKLYLPQSAQILKLLATLPVTSVDPERSFSALKRLRTYLRKSMGSERLTSLAILVIHYSASID